MSSIDNSGRQLVNSRQKGKRGELEACHYLKDEFGITARRTQQFCGKAGDSDIVLEDLPQLHVEVKRVEALNIHKAIEQAESDCKPGQVPVVLHRKNGKPWLATVKLTKENISNLLATLD